MLFFSALEVVLRLAGYGYPTAFFVRAQIGGRDVFVTNEKFGWRFFGPLLARTPSPVVLPVVKGPETCRVFVFGESAAFGDPEPAFGLPRLLEVLLRERFPNAHFEVVNAAMVAINSNVILPIARECARHQGDIWVIYMGNNEVVGPFGSGTVFGAQVPSLPLIKASLAVKGTRTGELLETLVRAGSRGRRGQSEWRGLEMFLQQQVRHDDPRMGIVYSHFSRNLADILAIGRAHGVKVIVSTLVSNLKDCAPFASLHRPGLTEASLRQWEVLYQSGVAADAAGRTAAAIEKFQEAGRIDANFAELQFRWGRDCLAVGQDAEAREHLALARDYDTLRFRADSQINALLRRATEGPQREGIVLADAEAALAQESPHGLPGNELLLEHVHFNFEGNYKLARCLSEEVAKVLPGAISLADSRRTWLSASECAQRLAFTEPSRLKIARSVLRLIQTPPFTAQFSHQEQSRRLQEQVETLLPAATPAALRAAVEQERQALTREPGDWVIAYSQGELLQQLGDLAGAEECWRRVTELLPQSSDFHVQLGLLLLEESRPGEAVEQFDTALRLNPAKTAARNGLGMALARQGDYTGASREYERLLKLKPLAVDALLNLGVALQAQGKTEAAGQEFRRALQCPCDNPEALVMIGRICLKEGWLPEAITNFATAANLDPADAKARFLYGETLAATGRRAEAQTRYEQALRLDPSLAEAHVSLGTELGRQGKHSEAMSEFNKALKFNPNLVQAHLNLAISLVNQHQPEEALRQFQEVIRLDPGNITARQYLQAHGEPSH